MNIEYITDADYDSIPKAKAAIEFNHAIGPPFQCGSLTFVKNCAHEGCNCQSINGDRQIQTTLDYSDDAVWRLTKVMMPP
jgi:hypothetical protein